MWCSTIRMRDAQLADRDNQFAELGGLLRVEAGGRLVEQQQLGFRRERPCELHAPLQAIGKAPCRRLRQIAKTKRVENCRLHVRSLPPLPGELGQRQ